MMALRFSADYEENVVLEDGTSATLRLLRSEDAPLLVKGFGELSADSRSMRFFGTKSSLSGAEVAHLIDVDGWNHLAIGAVARGLAGEEGVGVARFIRLRNDSEAAEMAITVADRLQGKGLGRILLQRLIQAARERHIKRFRFEVLTENARMLNLLHDVGPWAAVSPDGTVVHFQVPLDHLIPLDEAVLESHPLLHRIPALVASGPSPAGPHHGSRSRTSSASEPGPAEKLGVDRNNDGAERHENRPDSRG